LGELNKAQYNHLPKQNRTTRHAPPCSREGTRSRRPAKCPGHDAAAPGTPGAPQNRAWNSESGRLQQYAAVRCAQSPKGHPQGPNPRACAAAASPFSSFPSPPPPAFSLISRNALQAAEVLRPRQASQPAESTATAHAAACYRLLYCSSPSATTPHSPFPFPESSASPPWHTIPTPPPSSTACCVLRRAWLGPAAPFRVAREHKQ
jgi:hypothetical protein